MNARQNSATRSGRQKGKEVASRELLVASGRTARASNNKATNDQQLATLMKLSDLTNRAGEWLRGSGPMSEIVISSRIRLARNVGGYPFLSKCTRHQRQVLETRIRDTILGAAIA